MRGSFLRSEDVVVRFDFAINEFWSFALVLVRSAAILSALPLMGGRLAPQRVKVGLAIVVALVLTPVVNFQLNPGWLEPVHLIMGLAMEVFVGLVLGLATRFLMATVEMAGGIMGFQVGFGAAAVLDPVSQVQIPVFGQLLTVLATLLYFQVNGHHLILLALAASFSVIPPFGAHVQEALFVDIIQLVQSTMRTGIKLALPIMAVTFLIQLTLGILGRMVPQMNVLITSFPLTIFLGLLVLGLGLPLIALIFQNSVLGMESVLWTLLQDLGHG